MIIFFLILRTSTFADAWDWLANDYYLKKTLKEEQVY
jgi:hypothetical protein